jgi:hypothetical protein
LVYSLAKFLEAIVANANHLFDAQVRERKAVAGALIAEDFPASSAMVLKLLIEKRERSQ